MKQLREAEIKKSDITYAVKSKIIEKVKPGFCNLIDYLWEELFHNGKEVAECPRKVNNIIISPIYLNKL